MGITCLDLPQSGFSRAQINCTENVPSLLPTDAVEINSIGLPWSSQVVDRPGLEFRNQMQPPHLSNSALGARVVHFRYSMKHLGPVVAFHNDLEVP